MHVLDDHINRSIEDAHLESFMVSLAPSKLE